jgi:hypothetical protein
LFFDPSESAYFDQALSRRGKSVMGVHLLQEKPLRQKKKKNCWFPVTRPTPILTPDPTNFFFPTTKKSQHVIEIKTTTSYPSTMTVTDICHDIHLPVDKTRIFTARGSTVVSGLAL